jgi:polyhydroxybutyrate depolymerase
MWSILCFMPRCNALAKDGIMKAVKILAVSLLGCFFPFVAAATCPQSGECILPSGRYLAFPPKGWDGKTPLATLVFLHGYSQTPENYAEPTGWFMQFGEKEKVLIILPEGKEKTWSYAGSPMENRDDAAFIEDVLDDVEARYPVNKKRLWLSGFSQGASMVWYAGCAFGDRFAALAPVAGAFWEPLPPSCAKGPLNMLHIHGTADEVVPMQGRPIGDRWRQGDVMQSIAIMAGSNACKAADFKPAQSAASMDVCETMAPQCSNGKEPQIALCKHTGGHWFEKEYLEAGWAFVKSLQS